MKRYRYRYLCEGESEQKLIQVLKEKNLLLSGKVEIFNFAQNKVAKIIRKFSKSDYLLIVLDTDIINSDIFCQNITLLNKKKITYCIIAQNKNLEDELRISCQLNSNNQLFRKFYNTSSIREFKEKLIKDNNLYNKLQKNSFDIAKLWVLSNLPIKCDIHFIICQSNLYKRKNNE